MKNVLLNTADAGATAALAAMPAPVPAAPAAAQQEGAPGGTAFATALAAQQDAVPGAAPELAPAPADPILAGLLQALLGESPAVAVTQPAVAAPAVTPGEGQETQVPLTDPTLLAALGLLPVALPATPAAPASAAAARGGSADAWPAQAAAPIAAATPAVAPSQQDLGLQLLRLQPHGDFAEAAARVLPQASATTPAEARPEALAGSLPAAPGAVAVPAEVRAALRAEVPAETRIAAAQDSAPAPAVFTLPALDAGTRPQGAGAAQPTLPPTVELRGEPRQWQQPLMQALGDRLQLQIAGRSEQATITLSPPLLGRVEIAIRQQAGELQVRLSASHGEVTRQLQQVSESLRQDLVQRHSGEVTVQVAPAASARESGDARQAGRDPQAQQQQAQQQREQQEQRRPGLALHEVNGEEATASYGSAASAV